MQCMYVNMCLYYQWQANIYIIHVHMFMYRNDDAKPISNGDFPISTLQRCLFCDLKIIIITLKRLKTEKRAPLIVWYDGQFGWPVCNIMIIAVVISGFLLTTYYLSLT